MPPLPTTAEPQPQQVTDRRRHHIALRVSSDEYAKIAERAAQDHRSLSSYARATVLRALDGAEG